MEDERRRDLKVLGQLRVDLCHEPGSLFRPHGVHVFYGRCAASGAPLLDALGDPRANAAASVLLHGRRLSEGITPGRGWGVTSRERGEAPTSAPSSESCLIARRRSAALAASVRNHLRASALPAR